MFVANEQQLFLLVRCFEHHLLNREEWSLPVRLAVAMYYAFFHSPEVARRKIAEGAERLRSTHASTSDDPAYHIDHMSELVDIAGDYAKQNDREQDLANLVNRFVYEFGVGTSLNGAMRYNGSEKPRYAGADTRSNVRGRVRDRAVLMPLK